MKFLGIDTKVIGNDETISMTLNTLKLLEKRYKLYTNPDYLNKFFIVANVFHQNLYCDLINDKKENTHELFFTVYNLNEGTNSSHLYEQLQTNYESFIKESNTVTECLKKIDEFESTRFKTSEKDSLTMDSGIYTQSYYEDYEASYSDCTTDDFEQEGFKLSDFESDLESELYSENDSESESEPKAIPKPEPEKTPKKKIIKKKPSETALEEPKDALESKFDEDSHTENMNSIMKIIDCTVKTKKYVKLTLFKKDTHYDYDENTITYDTDNLYFLNSFLIGEHVPIRRKYHNINNLCEEKNEKFLNNLPVDIKNKARIFKDCFELNEIYMKKTPFDFDLVNKIMTNQTGIYINPADVLFTFIINKEIGSYISKEKLVMNLSQKFFKKTTFNKIYKHKVNNKNLIDKLYTSIDTGFVCDICEGVGSIKKRSFFYSNSEVGDICKVCYDMKYKDFLKRINFIKSRILLVGKREVFRREANEMRYYLSQTKIMKLPKKRRDEIAANILKETTKEFDPPLCKVCYSDLCLEKKTDELIPELDYEENQGNTNISIAVACGHIFHTGCILNMIDLQECPYCRQKTSFTRIFI